jgi:hypothetical protein
MIGPELRERVIARRTAIGVVVALVTLEIAHLGLGILTRSLSDQGGVIDVIYVITLPLVTAGFAVVGWAHRTTIVGTLPVAESS